MHTAIILSILSLLLGPLSTAPRAQDPNAAAEQLMQEATALAEQADAAESPTAALPLYHEARAKLQQIIGQFPSSRVAVRLVLGDPLTHRLDTAIAETEQVAVEERARVEAAKERCRLASTRTHMQYGACASRFERIRRGESRCGIALCEDDRIYMDGRAIGEAIVSWGRPEELVVFPASPGGRYRIVDACGSNCGRSFVLDLQQKKMQDTVAGRYGPEEDWIGWSPDGAYAVLAYKTEGVSWLYVIRVSDGNSWELLNEGLLVRPESLRWLDKETFEIRTVSCRDGVEACWTSVQRGATGDLVRATLTADGPRVERAGSSHESLSGVTARAPAERNYKELRVKPGQTSAWIEVPQGGCANWNADGAWVWIATPEGKVVLHSPGIRPTHIAFTAPDARHVNVRYYIDPSGNCADAVP